MPSLVQLEYIVAVADLKHFGKAADMCHVSQPTLSQQIRKVEELLDLVIFDRVKKPVVATQEGEAFLKQARLILREHKKLKELAIQNADEVSGEFRLAVIPTLASTLIPHFVQQFSKAYPKVTLIIDELKTSSILKELEEDRLDAALMATPLGIDGLIEEPLFYEAFQIYAAKGHRLLAKKHCRVEDLDASDLWLLQDGHCFKEQIAQICNIDVSDSRDLPKVTFQGGNLDTLLRLVKRGYGYTLIPAFMTSTMSESEINQHVRKFQKPYPTREISLVSRRSHRKRKTALAIKESIWKNLPEELSREKNQSQHILELCAVKV